MSGQSKSHKMFLEFVSRRDEIIAIRHSDICAISPHDSEHTGIYTTGDDEPFVVKGSYHEIKELLERGVQDE